ncbi:MAG: hypothetical protein M1818_005814 [Claussenomyces sp. TS43310]|nr:MAG: hypothetical protein M1818_005814 [Claussenomyces sp. TS43310]
MSLIRHQFSNQGPKWIKDWPGVEDHWNPCLQTLVHGSVIDAVAFSPDGRRLASTSEGMDIILWDAETGVLQQEISMHQAFKKLHPARYSGFWQDMRLLAIASTEDAVQLWNTETGALKHTLKGEFKSQEYFIFSPDGRRLVLPMGYGTIQLWDTETGALKHTLKVEVGGYWQEHLTFSSDGRCLAVPIKGSVVIQFWDTETGVLRRTWKTEMKRKTRRIKSLAFSPDMRRSAVSFDGKIIQLWHFPTGTVQQTLKGQFDRIRTMTFSPKGRRLASSSVGSIVRLWDTETGILQLSNKSFQRVEAIAFSPNGQHLASTSGADVQLWDTNIHALQQTPKSYLSWLRALILLLIKRPFVLLLGNRTIQSWEASTGSMQQTLNAYTEFVDVLAYSPNGQRFASLSMDWTMRLWDAKTGALQQTIDISGLVPAVERAISSPETGSALRYAQNTPSNPLSSSGILRQAVCHKHWTAFLSNPRLYHCHPTVNASHHARRATSSSGMLGQELCSKP